MDPKNSSLRILHCVWKKIGCENLSERLATTKNEIPAFMPLSPESVFACPPLGHFLAESVYAPLSVPALRPIHGRTLLRFADVQRGLMCAP